MSRRDFTSAKDLLPALLGRLTREGGPARALQSVWEREVGVQLARNSRVVALEHDVLTLWVSAPPWAQALRKQEQLLCARLTERIGPPGIRRLRFEDR